MKTTLLISTILMSISVQAASNPLEDWIRKLNKPKKYISLTSVREEFPTLKITPMLVSFKGVVKVPGYMNLVSGASKMSGSAGQLIIDGQVICNYSPRSNNDRYYVLQNCSNGSRSGEEIDVRSKLEVKLNSAGSTKASLVAKVVVTRTDEVGYGIKFPYIQASEGQILMYNGEAWVPADVSELNIDDGAKGDKGDQGEAGPMGPAGATGATGAPGVAGAKGDRGDAGSPGAAGPQGLAGAMGPMGPQGERGLQGLAGSAGSAGAQGPAGATGPMGPQGLQGVQGPRGEKGEAGAQGPVGMDGSMGAMGPQGLQGLQGPTGVDGKDGLAGAQGAAGPQGAKGERGEKGDRGLSEIAYLRDERAAGTQGGTCSVAAVWNPRSLNVLGGDVGFITLVGNRFVLQPGKYYIEATVPAYQVDRHQAKLKVIETNSDVMYGSSSLSSTTAPTMSQSVISGEIVVAQASTFEIQHRCQTDRSAIGFGLAVNFGTVEIYTQVKIIKKQ